MTMINIDTEILDGFTLANLKEALAFNEKENELISLSYQFTDEMPEYKREDYKYNKKLIKALKRVIHYYGG